MAHDSFPCANFDGKNGECKINAQYACKNCLLYCGLECQKEDWHRHKQYCRSSLMKSNWEPDWAAKDRVPTFIGDGGMTFFGNQKYLWGNVPALDILRLGHNEGESYGKDLRLLFAASGDLRNVVKTVASIPNSYKKHLTITINDKDLNIVARNVIMLLICLLVDSAEEAIDSIIHIWYSAFVKESHSLLLNTKIIPLIEDVCGKIPNKPSEAVLCKTWTYGARSLRLILTKKVWTELLEYFHVPADLTPQKAHEIRTAVTLAPQRRDFRERRYTLQTPAHRVAAERYRTDGLLLPFGQSRAQFKVVNPAMLQTDGGWPLKDSADPLDGWDYGQVLKVPCGAASSDLYGKLYFYVRELLRTFHGRLKTLDVSFELLNFDAKELPRHLEDRSFARIEVSNICDAAYIGFSETLTCLSPLLETRATNPKATMIMLFMNAVQDALRESDQHDGMSREVKLVKRYLLPVPYMFASMHSPSRIIFMAALPLVRDVDKYFDRYARDLNFTEAGNFHGMVMKKHHTIIEKWPIRLKKNAGQAGAQEEFKMLLQSAHRGSERYVEWKRAG